MNALMLVAVLSLGAADTDSPVLAGISLSGGARGTVPPEAVFNFGLQGFFGLRFGPVRFGTQVRGLFSTQQALDVGGFFTVDLVRAQLEARLSLALFTGFEVMGRWLPSRAPQWTAVTLGVFGVRALGLSLSFAGGAEFPLPQGAVGNGEVRFGVELVELITFFKLQSETSLPVF
ncbi:MAG: hypothetical protein Q8L48_00245 [Archangium sp.]|nr:hypothetical protein [Archangium sp.]